MEEQNNKPNPKENRDYWKAEEEKIIQQWADKAQCYQWMHYSRCREIYQKKNAWYTIPVIIFNCHWNSKFAQDRFPEDIKQYIVMGIGTLSIIAGIITTIYQFLQISELNEGYRAVTISWNKYYNTLKTLVLRHPLDRMPQIKQLKYQDEYERLIEISPPIVKKVLSDFNYKFKKNKDLVKPEICNKLEATEVFNMTKDERKTMIDVLNNKTQNKKLMETFFNLNGRSPSEEELMTLQENIHFEDDENDIDEQMVDINGVTQV